MYYGAAMNNRSVPVNTVLPHIVYRDVAQASAWLHRVFGFTEHYCYGAPPAGAQLFHGEAWIMIEQAREGRDTPSHLGLYTQMLTIFVIDVDAHYARSQREGAVIVEAINDTIYGERQYAVSDLDGHRWLFSQHAKDIAPEDWGAVVTRSQP